MVAGGEWLPSVRIASCLRAEGREAEEGTRVTLTRATMQKRKQLQNKAAYCGNSATNLSAFDTIFDGGAPVIDDEIMAEIW